MASKNINRSSGTKHRPTTLAKRLNDPLQLCRMGWWTVTSSSPLTSKNRHFGPHCRTVRGGCSRNLATPSCCIHPQHTHPLLPNSPQRWWWSAFVKRNLRLMGCGRCNILESDRHFEFCPLGHIQLFSALGYPGFKIPFGKLSPRQHGCAAWQVPRIGHVGEQASSLVDQRKLHGHIWATTRCVPITVRTDCKSYLCGGGGGVFVWLQALYNYSEEGHRAELAI